MSTSSGIGWLAFATSGIVALFLTVPGFWLWRMWSEDVRDSRFVELSALLAVGLVTAFGIVPMSLLDFGWVMVPVNVMVLSLSYISAHASARVVLGRHRREEGPGLLFAFCVPMIVLGVALTIIASNEIGLAMHSQPSIRGGLGPTAYASMLLLTLAPPYAATVTMAAPYIRKVFRRRRTRPMA